jgi:hypothetical protein
MKPMLTILDLETREIMFSGLTREERRELREPIPSPSRSG